MKVIKKGKIPKSTYIGTCTYCGCIMEGEYSELEQSEDRGQDQYTYKCSTCGQTIYFEQKNVEHKIPRKKA